MSGLTELIDTLHKRGDPLSRSAAEALWELRAAATTLAIVEAENERLREELAAAQRDAERYRWLAAAEPFSARWQIVRLEWWRGKNGWEPLAKERLDAAIDAAMKEKRDETA